MTSRQTARAIHNLRTEYELVPPTMTADDLRVWARVITEAQVTARTALFAARVHYENHGSEPLDPRAWLAALRRVRAVNRQRPRPQPDRREVLALARIGAASHAHPCPVCPADVGESCINATTGQPMAHGWHHQRTIAPVRVGA